MWNVFWAMRSPPFGWRRSAACRPGAAIEHELSQTVDGAPATFDVEAVEALPALALPDEESGVGQHLQMMRHRRARERKARGERADVQPLARQRDDDPLANGVAERDEEAAEVGQLRALRDGCSLVHPFKHLNQSTKAVKPPSAGAGRRSPLCERVLPLRQRPGGPARYADRHGHVDEAED